MNSGLKPVQRNAAELGLIFCGASTGYLCPSSIACFAERMRRSIRSREPIGRVMRIQFAWVHLSGSKVTSR